MCFTYVNRWENGVSVEETGGGEEEVKQTTKRGGRKEWTREREVLQF